MPIGKQYLTQEGYNKLLKELSELKDMKLPDVIKKLTEASEQGDISENAEYDDALARKDLLEARISEIQMLIENVEIIEKGSKGGQNQVVNYGSIVDLEFEDGRKETVLIVGSGEVGIEDEMLQISFESPIGMAIREKKAGETARIRISGSRKEVLIKAIR